VIVSLKSKNAELQEQLDTLMLSTDDADLYDFDVNGELRLVPTAVRCKQNNENILIFT